MYRITHQSPRPRGYGSTSSLRNDSLKHMRKHERRRGGIEPRSKEHRLWRTVRPGGADRPHRPRELSDLKPRTVRASPADCPALRRGPSVKAHRITRSEPRKTDRPPRPGGPSAPPTDRPLLELGPSANWLQQKPKAKPDRKQGRARTRRTRDDTPPADRPRPPRRPSAPRGQNRKPTTPKVNSPKSSSDFPNG
jgi:hypothetical protein